MTVRKANGIDIQVHPTARKHGLTPDEVSNLWASGVEATWIDDLDPRRLLRIGPDSAGRPWELVALVFDGGLRHLVIHAMPLRASTVQLMKRRRTG